MTIDAQEANIARLREALQACLHFIENEAWPKVDGGPEAAKAHAALDADLAYQFRGATKMIASKPVISPETIRLAGVIADKIEDGTLLNPSFYRRTDIADIVRMVTAAAALAQPMLYQHDDGRYGLSSGPAQFSSGDPAWHRVPIDVIDFGRPGAQGQEVSQ